LQSTFDYVRREVFDDVTQFLDRVIAVDFARAVIVQSKRQCIVAAVMAAAAKDHEGRLILDQPIRADLFRVIRS
jgi:hypothetical protein